MSTDHTTLPDDGSIAGYIPPTVTDLGSLADLTLGGDASVPDASGGASVGSV